MVKFLQISPQSKIFKIFFKNLNKNSDWLKITSGSVSLVELKSAWKKNFKKFIV